jgi:DNA-directed RNA polymerase subunit RPC12/RpoP
MTRRLIGLERHYRCRSCGSEPRSWARLAACPDCGHMFMTAVIRRAALAE